MGRKSKAIIFTLVVVFAACLTVSDYAYAGNGLRMLGFSTRDSAMAGATTASSEDTSCLVRNPAGLSRIGNRIDAEYMNILPYDVTMHTEGPVSAALGVPLANVGTRQKSDVGYIPGVNAGASYSLPGISEHPISVGIGAFTIAGVAVDFPHPRLNPALSGDYDEMVDLRILRIAPGFAIELTDKLSFGMTGNFEIQGLKTDMATNTLNLTTGRYPETAGGGKWDFAVGGGFTAGLLYQLNDMFSVGASYESHGWMRDHYRYKDVLPYIDEPPVINLGLSFKPVKQLELTYDTRYINWTDVKLARIKPNQGGFGWQDQWVFAIGGEYTTCNEKLKLRLGYNYGKSPIQQRVAFANALLPVIVEHHLTAGFSYNITKNLSADLTWEHHFFNTMDDQGDGDVYSQLGQGTKITAAGDVISVGVGYKF